MLTKTHYTVSLDKLQEALNSIQSSDFRTTINKPTGHFFYDPWIIQDEYRGTVWEEILNTINEPIGEARFIILAPRQSYHSHADIDDRFHLNLKGEMSYLIDLDMNKTHKLEADGVWYDMDAGRLHTASNFGRFDRIQLVVRKNLIRGNIKNPVRVGIVSTIENPDSRRFIFDNRISPWLNNANKQGIMDNFIFSTSRVEFDLEEKFITELKHVLGEEFKVEL